MNIEKKKKKKSDFYYILCHFYNCHHCLFLELAVLEDNKDLENILSEFQMPKMQYGTLRIAGFGKTAIKDSFSSVLTHFNITLLKIEK